MRPVTKVNKEDGQIRNNTPSVRFYLQCLPLLYKTVVNERAAAVPIQLGTTQGHSPLLRDTSFSLPLLTEPVCDTEVPTECQRQESKKAKLYTAQGRWDLPCKIANVRVCMPRSG